MVSAGEEAAITAAQPGALFGGRFRIEATLGQGGMGAVYLAHDERDGRRLALKQLVAPPGANQALLFSQFEREYHTLVQLAHPRIIEVYDYGVEGGSAFYTMELLDGEDLRERGKQGWREACALLCDIASSLAILHSRRLIHRDISARNVRCTRDGRAKLIDFGAMATMGVVKHVVGTPPFVPPEALQLQALDGRSDLYALGTLAYWMLTGRYPYPARSFAQLRDLWRSPPLSPRQYDAGVPELLDSLVMQLIQLDRIARPASAAEVIERLSGIAGLQLESLPEVSQAYLAMPTLVGREQPLQDVRRSLVSAMQGMTGSLLIEGEGGVGRSRFLDAAVLEAKLLGAIVLRGDASEAGSDYGLVRALGEQLMREAPQLALRAARPWRMLLAEVIPGLERKSLAPVRTTSERRHLQSALRNWFALIARKKHVVIAVDDVHDVDEPSAALLGTLAHSGKGQKLSLLLTSKQGAPETAALQVLREAAERIALAALSAQETLSLLRSVFGDVAHVNSLAERVHRLAHGHPRWTMALCERLVERRTARYEAGSWTLPAELTAEDLPASLTALLTARITALSADALELAQALSLTDPTAVATNHYPALSARSDSAAVHRAIDELVATAVLVPDGTKYRFSQYELKELLEAGIAHDRKAVLHARIASALARDEHPALLARHLLLGGREREGIDLVMSLRDHEALAHSHFVLNLVETALRHAESLGLPLLLQLELRMWLVSQASLLGEYERFNHHAWPLLEQCERDSGLADYLDLEGSGLSDESRLRAALERTSQRYAALPDAERGFHQKQACERLGRLCGVVMGMAAIAMELAMMERLPNLAPLVSVYPSASLVQLHIELSRAMHSSRYDVATRCITDILSSLEKPHPDVNPVYAEQLRLGCLYMRGLLTAGIAHPNTPAVLKQLEDEPGHRVLAWRVYMAYELMLGKVEAAAECQRRAELLNLQDGGQLIFPGTTAAFELNVCALADDLLGVKRQLERITALADQYPGWRPYVPIARAHYHRLQGDFDAALTDIDEALGVTGPGRSQSWGFAVLCHVQLLLAARAPEEAIVAVRHYLDVCARESLGSTLTALQRLAAEALAKAGQAEEAREMADAHIARYTAAGARGLTLGLAYETRARVAIAMQDEAALRKYAELCAQEYKGGRNLTLSGKYQALMREASACGVTLTSSIQQPDEPDSLLAGEGIAGRSANSRLLACIGTEERVREGMRLLLELTGATRGYLFQVHDGRLELSPHLEQAQPPNALGDLLTSYMHATLASEEDVTGVESETPESTAATRFSDDEGRSYEPLMLYSDRGDRTIVVAVALLHYAGASRPSLRRDVLELLADAFSDDNRSEELSDSRSETDSPATRFGAS